MRQQLPHRDLAFAVLCELWPVRRYLLVPVEQAMRVRDCERDRRHSFGRREHDHHRVGLPRRLRLRIANTSPQIDDAFAFHVDATRGPELAALPKVLSEGVTDAL